MIVNGWDNENVKSSNEGGESSDASKKALFIGVPVLIGVLILLFVFRSFGANPKNMFFDSYKNELIERTNIISEILGQDVLNKMQDGSFELNASYKPKLEVEGDFVIDEIGQFLELINELYFTMDIKDNKNESLQNIVFNALLDGEKMIEAEAVYNTLDADRFFLRSPQLYDKYLAFTEEEMEDVLGVENFNMEFLNFNQEGLKPFEDAIEKVFKNFYVHFYDFVLNEEFSLDKNVSISVAGKKIRADKISLNLSKDRLELLLKEIAEKLKNDKKLHEDLMKIIENHPGTMGIDLGEEDLRTAFIDSLKEIADSILGVNITQGLNSSLYMDDTRKMIRQITSFGLEYNDDKINFEIENGNYRTTDNYFESIFNLSIGDDEQNVRLSYKREGTPDSDTDDVINHVVKGELSAMEGGINRLEVVLDMSAKERFKDNQAKVFEAKDGSVKVSAALFMGLQELASLNIEKMRLETWGRDLEKGYQIDFEAGIESEAGEMFGLPNVDFALSAGMNEKRDSKHEIFEDDASFEVNVHVKDPQQSERDIKLILGLDINSMLDTTVTPEIQAPQSGEYESPAQMTQAQLAELEETIGLNIWMLMQENPLFKAGSELVGAMFMGTMNTSSHSEFEQELYFDDADEWIDEDLSDYYHR